GAICAERYVVTPSIRLDGHWSTQVDVVLVVAVSIQSDAWSHDVSFGADCSDAGDLDASAQPVSVIVHRCLCATAEMGDARQLGGVCRAGYRDCGLGPVAAANCLSGSDPALRAAVLRRTGPPLPGGGIATGDRTSNRVLSVDLAGG